MGIFLSMLTNSKSRKQSRKGIISRNKEVENKVEKVEYVETRGGDSSEKRHK